ncbi:LOW QUALITY PROTEIN: hypothetical protein Cgig2_034167 [Carnegiea gigantea]|uniref:Uncharacterized protein n=1 Tax=Carnegiea gigantea TaxID=171969 RepID=A0A9Q1JTV9_9CARY|nr:LOW QUALITY PROTEIN: hypothetical protein Cgig2_034167 [Carnegiea gigantea]
MQKSQHISTNNGSKFAVLGDDRDEDLFYEVPDFQGNIEEEENPDLNLESINKTGNQSASDKENIDYLGTGNGAADLNHPPQEGDFVANLNKERSCTKDPIRWIIVQLLTNLGTELKTSKRICKGLGAQTPTKTFMRAMINQNNSVNNFTIHVWNVQGAGGDNFLHTLKEIIRRYDPKIVALVETRISGDRVEQVCRKIGFNNHHRKPKASKEEFGFAGTMMQSPCKFLPRRTNT